MATSIWSRKLDLVYLIFFVTHLPVMLVVDLSKFYPASVRPRFITGVRDYYINNYKDRFFIDPPLWFDGFLLIELSYHLPLTIWAIPAILRNDRIVPLQLLVFATVVVVTTFTCALEMLSWEGYSSEEKIRLLTLYLPYLGLALLMGSDMFMRLRKLLLGKNKIQ